MTQYLSLQDVSQVHHCSQTGEPKQTNQWTRGQKKSACCVVKMQSGAFQKPREASEKK